MRIFKPLINMVSVKLIWQRINFSKFTLSFFLVALLHCFVQVGLEAFAYNINASALDLLRGIVAAGSANGTVATGVAIFDGDELRICQGVPSAGNCKLVWSASSAIEEEPIAQEDSAPAPQAQSSPAAVETTADPATRITLSPSESSTLGAGGAATVIPPQRTASTPAVSSSSSSTRTVPFSSSSSSSIASSTTVQPVRTSTTSVSRTPTPTPSPEILSAAIDDSDSESGSEFGDDDSVFSADSDVGENGKRDLSDFDDEDLDEGYMHNDVFNVVPIFERDEEPSILRKFNATGGFVGVLVVDPHLKDGRILASPTCIASLQIPIQTLRDTKRVDLTFIAFQIWVLGMSVVALLNESVPHIIASLLTHLFATGWSGYQLRMTADFQSLVTRLVVQGPCQANLLPEYWDPRRKAEIAVASLNSAFMVIIAFLSYKLVKSFGWQTFKRIGASFVINRVYRLVLAFSIIIQLSVFFIGANVTLWIDQLYNGNVARYAEHRGVYEIVFIFVLSMLLPWLTMGWFAVRRESRFWMHVFIILGVLMISGWTLMFTSISFRWTFRMWDFFAFITIVAAVLLTCTIVLSVWCRLNFGKGLPRYLGEDQGAADEPKFEDMDVKAYDDEKLVQFPSRDDSPVPTFSVAFGQGAAVLPALQRLGAAPGIAMHARGGSISEPAPSYSGPAGRPRADSGASQQPIGGGPANLMRSQSGSSTSSGASSNAGGESYRGRQRWLIE